MPEPCQTPPNTRGLLRHSLVITAPSTWAAFFQARAARLMSHACRQEVGRSQGGCTRLWGSSGRRAGQGLPQSLWPRARALRRWLTVHAEVVVETRPLKGKAGQGNTQRFGSPARPLGRLLGVRPGGCLGLHAVAGQQAYGVAPSICWGCATQSCDCCSRP